MASKMIAIDKMVSELEEAATLMDVGVERFKEARAELRRACPTGTLHFRLYVIAEEPQAFKEPDDHYSQDSGLRPLTRHERRQMAADHGFDTLEDYRGER